MRIYKHVSVTVLQLGPYYVEIQAISVIVLQLETF